ncbi:hypothetical protein LSUE1_G007725 [Lachnellula suecica]|uniref:Indole-diterpene biosynthesis protein PaxU n=1 Tax=Lachnellula suecica TaxID=602035 RepID=A0A8T9C875_9HELO|nr:hypothetical protein LSUE1_G007725 [Lachnellula suecica]
MAARVATADLEFTRLNSVVSLYTPPASTAATSTHDPTTIIFCQWMGVGPKSRYVKSFYSHYHTLYPNARIITIRSPIELFLYTRTSTRRGYSRAVTDAILSDPAPEKRILVHLLSNGGTLVFADACHVYKEQTGNILPVKAIVFDSAPGESSFGPAFNAFAVSLPKGIMWYPSAAILAAFLGSASAYKALTGHLYLPEQTAVLLNDWELVDRNAARLYVYSEADMLVRPEPVERHAREAEAKGSVVRLLKENDTAHVQHMMHHTERYWQTVSYLWSKANP